MQARNQGQRESRPEDPGGGKQGLVLDDFLQAIGDLRRLFELPTPKFGLKEIEQCNGASNALKTIIRSTVDRHGSEVYSKRNPLFSKIKGDIYAAQISGEAYSGWKISPDWVNQVVGTLLERALQTIAQLPALYPRRRQSVLRSEQRSARTLSSRMRKWADELEGARQREHQHRTAALDNEDQTPPAFPDDFARFLPAMLRRDADLRDETRSRTRLLNLGPNPQIRAAILLSTFIKVATGQFSDKELATLLVSTFETFRKPRPSWIDRLVLERSRNTRRLIRLFKMWTSRFPSLMLHPPS